MANGGPRQEEGLESHHQLVQLTARIETSHGPLRGKVTVYTGPTRLAELVPPLQALTEGLVGLVLSREQRAGRQISCKAGCGACCRQMVALSVPEAFYLRDLVASLPAERRQVVSERFAYVVGKLERHGLSTRLQKSDVSDEDYLQITQEYFRLQLPCPFLEKESCTIYPAQPLACREYLVTTPAAWCADPYAHPVKRPKPAVAVPVVLARLSADLFGLPARLIPLTLALRWAADHPDLHQRTWPGRWLFERLLAHFNSPERADPADDG